MVKIPAEQFNLPFGATGHLEVQAQLKQFDHLGRSGTADSRSNTIFSTNELISLHQRGREYMGESPTDRNARALLNREGGAIQVLWKVAYDFRPNLLLLGIHAPALRGSGRGNILQSWRYVRQVRDGVLQQLSPVERPAPDPTHDHASMEVVVNATSQDYHVGENYGELTCWLSIRVAHSSSSSATFSVRSGPAQAQMGSSSPQHRGASVSCRVLVRYRSHAPGNDPPLPSLFELLPRSAPVR